MADAERDYRAAVERESRLHREASTPGNLARRPSCTGRASCRAIIDGVLNDRQSDGAEQEAQRAAGLNSDGIPWAMLAEPELRADADAGTPATIGTTQRPIIDRVFARSALSALGVAMPAAAVGDEVYHVTSAGAAGAYASGSTAVDAGPFTLLSRRIEAPAAERWLPHPAREPSAHQGLRAPRCVRISAMRLSNRADAQNLGAGDSVQRGSWRRRIRAVSAPARVGRSTSRTIWRSPRAQRQSTGSTRACARS